MANTAVLQMDSPEAAVLSSTIQRLDHISHEPRWSVLRRDYFDLISGKKGAANNCELGLNVAQQMWNSYLLADSRS